MYIYYYFIILLGVYVFYDTRFDTIHDTEKLKINSRFDNYSVNIHKEKSLVMIHLCSH